MRVFLGFGSKKTYRLSLSTVSISLFESTKPLSFSDSDKFFPLGMRISEGRPGILYFFCKLSFESLELVRSSFKRSQFFSLSHKLKFSL